MDNMITDEELQIAAGLFIAMRQQLHLDDDMIFNFIAETKSGVCYKISCEKIMKEGEKK